MSWIHQQRRRAQVTLGTLRVLCNLQPRPCADQTIRQITLLTYPTETVDADLTRGS